MELAEQQFGHGGLQSPADPRDYHYNEIGFGSTPFDWAKGYDVEAELGQKIPVKNQGTSGSCGGQADSYYGEVLEALATGSFEERSAKFPYAQVFVQGGGSRLFELMDLNKSQGWAREAILSSYEAGNPPSEQFMERVEDITDSVRSDASTAKALLYTNVSLDIDSVSQAVRDNHGAIILIQGENNGTWLSQFPKPPVPGAKTWAHFLYVGKAKIIDGKKFVGVLNSWGDTVGDHGWQWIGEEYFTSRRIVECKTLVYAKQEIGTLKHHFAYPMKLGDVNDEVKYLQHALAIDGEFLVKPTGYYGQYTRKAVLKFQMKYNVAPIEVLTALNGENVGPATRAKLNELFNK